MISEQADVRDFMDLCRQTVNDRPTVPSEEVQQLRVRLIEEESRELEEAMGYVRNAEDELVRIGPPNLAAVADALSDLNYVVYGAGNAFGIDLEPVFAAAHAANMSKAPYCDACAGTGRLREELSDPEIEEDCFLCGGAGRLVEMTPSGKIQKPAGWRHPDIEALIEAQAR